MQTFTGREYLQIDIANNFGLDKKSWQDRLEWFEEHQDHLPSMLHQAEEPALFFAGVQAWEQVQKGQPIGYPISLDATSSGLQLLTVLTGDRKAAEICNVVDVGYRSDAYTTVYNNMIQQLGEDNLVPEPTKLAPGPQLQILTTYVAKITREDVKRSVMTALYGSTAVPKEVFGKGAQLEAFLNVMEQIAPAAWELNQHFLDIWNDNALSNDWVLPDNFHVHVKVMSQDIETIHVLNEPIEIVHKVNAPVKEGRSLGANTIHSVDGFICREMARRCDYDPAWIELLRQMLNDEVEFHFEGKKQKTEAHKMVGILWKHFQDSRYLSARILDYLDSDTLVFVDSAEILKLIDSMPAKPFKMLQIHDCFRVLPQYGNDLRTQYNLQLHLLAKSDVLSFLLSQLVGREVKINKLDDTLAQDILDSDYALS
jgi:hypothetical protein